jgi:hypothetical protein
MSLASGRAEPFIAIRRWVDDGRGTCHQISHQMSCTRANAETVPGETTGDDTRFVDVELL